MPRYFTHRAWIMSSIRHARCCSRSIFEVSTCVSWENPATCCNFHLCARAIVRWMFRGRRSWLVTIFISSSISFIVETLSNWHIISWNVLFYRRVSLVNIWLLICGTSCKLHARARRSSWSRRFLGNYFYPKRLKWILISCFSRKSFSFWHRIIWLRPYQFRASQPSVVLIISASIGIFRR